MSLATLVETILAPGYWACTLAQAVQRHGPAGVLARLYAGHSYLLLADEVMAPEVVREDLGGGSVLFRRTGLPDMGADQVFGPEANQAFMTLPLALGAGMLLMAGVAGEWCASVAGSVLLLRIGHTMLTASDRAEQPLSAQHQAWLRELLQTHANLLIQGTPQVGSYLALAELVRNLRHRARDAAQTPAERHRLSVEASKRLGKLRA